MAQRRPLVPPSCSKCKGKRENTVTSRTCAKDRKAWLLSVLPGKAQHLVWQYCFPSYNTEDSFLEWNCGGGGFPVSAQSKWGKYVLWLICGCLEIILVNFFSHLSNRCSFLQVDRRDVCLTYLIQLLLFTEGFFQLQYPGTIFPSISSQRLSMNVGQSDSWLPFAALSIWLPVLMFLCLNR